MFGAGIKYIHEIKALRNILPDHPDLRKSDGWHAKVACGRPPNERSYACGLFRVSNNRKQPKKHTPRDGLLGGALAALVCLQQGWRKSAGVEAREPTAPISADRRPPRFGVRDRRFRDRAAVCRRGCPHHPGGLYRRESAYGWLSW